MVWLAHRYRIMKRLGLIVELLFLISSSPAFSFLRAAAVDVSCAKRKRRARTRGIMRADFVF